MKTINHVCQKHLNLYPLNKQCIKQDSSNSTEETPCTVKRQDHSSSISYKTQYKTTIRNAMETLKDKVEGGRESLPSWVEM